MEDLDQNYARAGYHHGLGFGDRPALILIDFARAYFEPRSPLYAGVEATLASALRLLAAARATPVMRVMTKVAYRKGLADGGIFTRKVPALRAFEEGNPLGDWAEGLEPRDDEIVVTKQYPSAFLAHHSPQRLRLQKLIRW